MRSAAYQLKSARFPAYRDLADFDFTSSKINEALVRQLHRCDVIDVADNIVNACVNCASINSNMKEISCQVAVQKSTPLWA